jgi:hypothetical protein
MFHSICRFLSSSSTWLLSVLSKPQKYENSRTWAVVRYSEYEMKHSGANAPREPDPPDSAQKQTGPAHTTQT